MMTQNCSNTEPWTYHLSLTPIKIPSHLPSPVCAFDSLLSYLMLAYSERIVSKDNELKELIVGFIKQGRLIQIVMRHAWNWYAEHERMSVFFEYLVSLIPRVTYCLCLSDFMPTENDMRTFELYNCYCLMKQELEDVFYVPNSQTLTLAKLRHFLGVFLHFLIEILNDQYTEELLQSHKSEMNDLCNDIATLSKDLRFLITYLNDTHCQCPLIVNEIGVTCEIKDVANCVGQICYSLFIGKISTELSIVLSDSLSKIELIKEKVKAHMKEMGSAICSTWTSHEFTVLFGSALLEHLNELLKQNSDMVLSIKTDTELLMNELSSSICFLVNAKHQELDNETLRDLMTHLVGVIDKVDYLVGSFLVHSGPVWYFKARLLQQLKEVLIIKEQLMHIEDNQKCAAETLEASPNISSGYSPQNISSMNTELLLDFHQEQELKNHLIGGSRGLKCFTIVGMPGLGKTTFARKIYGDPQIINKFSVRLFFTVSPAYQRRLLLLDIIRSIGEPIYDLKRHEHVPLDAWSDEDLATAMYQFLKGKRYLLVMDDVWDAMPWDDFLVWLPDDSKGSRVIFTSRSEDLSIQGKPNTIFRLSFFSDDHSWNLLRQNLFQSRECPLELEAKGKEIAKKCQGLPLLVNLAAGLLKDTDGKLELWDIISQSFSSHREGDSNVNDKILEQSERILEHSYENLPYSLKACFLYCGSFPKEKTISVTKLKLLWVAEGFIVKGKDETVDDAAENCLRDLINRSLLLVVDRRSNGSVKTCRIHALLHDFCLRKADEMHFRKMINSYWGIYERHHRLVITNPDSPGLFSSMPLGPNVCSLVANLSLKLQNRQYDVSFLFCGFKLLRVLDLEEVQAPKFPKEIGQLVLLRYLAIRCKDPSIPSSLSNLRNLETFTVNALTIPDASVLCGLSKLKHLSFCKDSYAMSDNKCHENAFNFPSVQTLSCVCLSRPRDVELLRRFPNLRKLRCRLASYGLDQPVLSTSHLPAISFLEKLEALNFSTSLGFNRHKPVISTLSLTSSLRQLTLSELGLPWEKMSEVGKSLPKLQILKLLRNAFEGNEWFMGSDAVEFPELKLLKMEKLNIKWWKIAHDNDEFPKLQQLKVFSCNDLEEIPGSFAHLPSLQIIDLRGCNSSTNASAMKIKQIQQDYYDGFQVFSSMPGAMPLVPKYSVNPRFYILIDGNFDIRKNFDSSTADVAFSVIYIYFCLFAICFILFFIINLVSRNVVCWISASSFISLKCKIKWILYLTKRLKMQINGLVNSD